MEDTIFTWHTLVFCPLVLAFTETLRVGIEAGFRRFPVKVLDPVVLGDGPYRSTTTGPLPVRERLWRELWWAFGQPLVPIASGVALAFFIAPPSLSSGIGSRMLYGAVIGLFTRRHCRMAEEDKARRLKAAAEPPRWNMLCPTCGHISLATRLQGACPRCQGVLPGRPVPGVGRSRRG